MALDSTGAPVTVSPSEDPCRNIIMWLDHRAVKQAQMINVTKHKVVDNTVKDLLHQTMSLLCQSSHSL